MASATWTITYTKRYTDNEQVESGIKIAPTTYQSARSEFARVKRIMQQLGYKMTRFSATEYGFANQYSTEVIELVNEAS